MSSENAGCRSRGYSPKRVQFGCANAAELRGNADGLGIGWISRVALCDPAIVQTENSDDHLLKLHRCVDAPRIRRRFLIEGITRTAGTFVLVLAQVDVDASFICATFPENYHRAARQMNA